MADSDTVPILRAQEEDVCQTGLSASVRGVKQSSRQLAGRTLLSRIAVGLASVAAVAVFVAVTRPRFAGGADKGGMSNNKLFLAESPDGKCVDLLGVKTAETHTTTFAWPACVAKWTEDCTKSGCCVDWGMECYEKNDGWAACKEKCDTTDEKNESWTCMKLKPAVEHTFESCKAICLEGAGCQQAVFNSDAGGSCSLTPVRQSKLVWAGDNFNSSYCGNANEADAIKAMAKEITDQLPTRLPQEEPKLCSWAGEDCSATKCCNEVECDVNFTQCFPYSCYKKTDYFAGCRIHEPDSDWDGTWLGGGREIRTIPPAGRAVAVQGTSLYCFAVVAWSAPAPSKFWSTEAELADNIIKNGVGLMQCDAHDFYNGTVTPKAAWGSFSNIDIFRGIWNQVKQKGTWKKYDWTVKVDVDAVFIPSRLKQHLDKLRTPLGSRVYLENNEYRFKFMGALEILTREALELYLDKSDECIRGKHEGGEDFFMKGCMNGLGIDHMEDFDLLHDKYAANDGPCTDGWGVAYHFHKKVISWNWCYNEVMCGTRDKTCKQGLEVEYVLPYGADGSTPR